MRGRAQSRMYALTAKREAQQASLQPFEPLGAQLIATFSNFD